MAIATVGGIGHLPGGPGTYAAILTAPIVAVLHGHGSILAAAVFAGAVVIGTVASDGACSALGEPDSRKVVIDEVLGMWGAMLAFETLTWAEVVALLVLFRLFDILKPWPVSAAEQRWHSGWGVVADDLVAGAMAAAVLSLCRLAI